MERTRPDPPIFPEIEPRDLVIMLVPSSITSRAKKAGSDLASNGVAFRASSRYPPDPMLSVWSRDSRERNDLLCPNEYAQASYG